ncbi:MAG: acetyl-CoA carboxylase biotin carboxyl carrier protein subunit [Bacteroidetes bacterium]|nr:acetyl-CoA carboxylase biotin carboxyl carrier protein subunit [Bacteroidota bacterium]
MYKINVNDKYSFAVDVTSQNEGKINDKLVGWDIIEIKRGSFHVILGNKSYTAEVVKADLIEKFFEITVNGTKYKLSVKDKFDELLKTLGIDNLNNNKVNEIKAPMPGLVIDVRVSEGNAVKKGDAIIVLEAMKMENILKSPTDGIVKKINVKKGTAVEKNQVLINFV